MDRLHIDEFVRRLPELILEADIAWCYGESWRDFKVGSCVLAWNGQDYRTFRGCNAKPLKDGPKFCAETIAVQSAKAYGYDTIIAIIVVGQPQKHEEETVTLHPCWVCRTFLAATKGVSEDTIIYTVNQGDPVGERHTLAEMLAIHGDRRCS